MADPVGVVHLLRTRLDRVGTRHVGDDARHLALAFEAPERNVQHRLLDVGDDDLRAFLEERLHQALTDAARTPGDDRDLAVEVLH